MCFFTLFRDLVLGRVGVVPMDWYTTCSCSFSPCTSQKWKLPKLSFLATHGDHPSSVKHFLGSIHVLCLLLGNRVYGGGGGGVLPMA